MAEKTEPKEIDYLKKIGRNFNPTNAKEIFGDSWLEALLTASSAGGYGVTTEAGFVNGLAIPDPALVEGNEPADIKRRELYAAHRANINAALNGVK